MHSTVNFSGNILFLIFAAYVFSYAISFAGIGEKLTEFIVGMQLSTFQFYAVLFVLFTVLGCLIESLGMIVITVPLLFPILGKYGIDPILFGVILVIYIELGQISPPIGINLFVIQSIWDGKLSEVVYGTIPFHLIMFVVLIMVMVWPELALWLPRQMSGTMTRAIDPTTRPIGSAPLLGGMTECSPRHGGRPRQHGARHRAQSRPRRTARRRVGYRGSRADQCGAVAGGRAGAAEPVRAARVHPVRRARLGADRGDAARPARAPA